MNLESTKTKTPAKPMSLDLEMDDFDFKPITSGLGFHQPKPTPDIRPAMPEMRVSISSPVQRAATAAPAGVYQNDLSLFYGGTSAPPTLTATPVMTKETKTETILRNASSIQRVVAYSLDLMVILSMLALVLTAMARAMKMDLLSAWSEFPHEITPLVVTLFCGFYILYFSIFEKSGSSTLGKSLVGIKVLRADGTHINFNALILRSGVTLLNFISLGLFSYFDLQNKITHSRVIRDH